MSKKKSKAELQAELAKGKSVAEIAAETSEVVKDTVPAQTPAPTPTPLIPAPVEPKAVGKIQQILAHFKAGMSLKEIAQQPVLDGYNKPIPTGTFDKDGNVIYETFNPTTISIQTTRYKKANPDLYPPVVAGPTKAALKAEAKAKKEKEEAEKKAAEQANAPIVDANVAAQQS